MKRDLATRLNSATVHMNRALRRPGAGEDLAAEHRSALGVVFFTGSIRMGALVPVALDMHIGMVVDRVGGRADALHERDGGLPAGAAVRLRERLALARPAARREERRERLLIQTRLLVRKRHCPPPPSPFRA